VTSAAPSGRSPAALEGDPLAPLRARAADRESGGLRRALRPRPAHDGLLDLASNDYLGLAHDSRVTAAAAAAAVTWGAGATGSRLVTGSTELHASLERDLATFVGAQAGLVFSSGYLANLGAVTALSGPGTTVVSDARNHASIVDACRLSRAHVVVTGHRDTAGVQEALSTRVTERALVVTDAVFSVDGDLAPLAALHDVTRAYGALLIVDEAHSLGVVGAGGTGAACAAGLAGAPDVVLTVTLSKSLGAQGGAVLGDAVVIEHLLNTARTFIFDTGLAPASTAAASAALAVLCAEPQLAGAVRSRAHDLERIAAELGLAPTHPDAAVVSLPMPSPTAAVDGTAHLLAQGIRVGCFRPPSVSDGISRLRLTARADLADADLDALGAALSNLVQAKLTQTNRTT
jgi:8-amino-7-oxononanoate synthase